MTDMENVIKGLENLSEWLFQQYQVVYDGDAPNYYDAYKTVDEALALLKKQEAVKPLKSKLSFAHGFDWEIWDCGCCGNQLRSFAKYCDQCGRAVKWDE